jgi:hypothetical protein
MERHHAMLSGFNRGQGLIGYVRADGTREPIYKFADINGYFRRVTGETGPAEFKRPLVDPRRMVRLITKHLAIFEHGAFRDSAIFPT